MQAGVLISGTQFGKVVEPGALRRETDAAGKVDGAVIQAFGQLVEADLDPLVFPARIARDGREQGHGIAGKMFAFSFKDAVLAEIAHTDDSGRFIVGSDVFGGEKVESRPVQGQARFHRGFPGGSGCALGNGQEQTKQEKQKSSEHGTFSHHAAARRHGITAGLPGAGRTVQKTNIQRIVHGAQGAPGAHGRRKSRT